MKTIGNLKEFLFNEEKPNAIIPTKSLHLKFKIQTKTQIRSISEKTLKTPPILDFLNITPIKKINEKVKIFQIKPKEKPFFIEGKIIKDEKTLNNNKNMIQYKNDFKFSKIISIYSDCISDLDTDFSYFHSKIQKNLKKKTKELSEKFVIKSEETAKLAKNKLKNSKILKNKSFLKLKLEISKGISQNTQEIVNFPKQYFVKKSLLKNEDSFDNYHKLSIVFIIHLTIINDFISFQQKMQEFLYKINKICFVILIFPNNSSLENMDFLYSDAIFIENIVKKPLEYLLIDYDEIISEFSFKKTVKNLIITSEINTNLEENRCFHGIFPKNYKNYDIDLIYFQKDFFLNCDILLQFLQNFDNKSHVFLTNDSIIELEIKKIIEEIEINELKQIFIDQFHKITENMKSKQKNSLIKEPEIIEIFNDFKKNIVKKIKKLKKNHLSFDILKLITIDIIKRNVPYLGGIITNPLSNIYNNQALFKKMNKNPIDHDQDPKKSSFLNLNKSKIHVFFIKNSIN